MQRCGQEGQGSARAEIGQRCQEQEERVLQVYISSKHKHSEDADLLPNRAGKILSGHADKGRGSQHFLCLYLYQQSWTTEHRIR